VVGDEQGCVAQPFRATCSLRPPSGPRGQLNITNLGAEIDTFSERNQLLLHSWCGVHVRHTKDRLFQLESGWWWSGQAVKSLRHGR
jgi:hypothetical protein